jgi:uncharacterized membrane protein
MVARKFTKTIGRLFKPSEERRLRNETPVEALHLNEDIRDLETILHLLGKIDPANIGENLSERDRESFRDLLYATRNRIRLWHRFARRKLQTEYLAP